MSFDLSASKNDAETIAALKRYVPDLWKAARDVTSSDLAALKLLIQVNQAKQAIDRISSDVERKP